MLKAGQCKANFYGRWGTDAHRRGWTVRRASGYDDFASDTPENLRDVDDFTTHDITYVNNMVENLTATVSIFNALDEDPPQVANDLSNRWETHEVITRTSMTPPEPGTAAPRSLTAEG